MPKTDRPPLKPYSFRLTPETIRQVRELARTWGESQTGVIARCVERAYQQEVKMTRLQVYEGAYWLNLGDGDVGAAYAALLKAKFAGTVKHATLPEIPGHKDEEVAWLYYNGACDVPDDPSASLELYQALLSKL